MSMTHKHKARDAGLVVSGICDRSPACPVFCVDLLGGIPFPYRRKIRAKDERAPWTPRRREATKKFPGDQCSREAVTLVNYLIWLIKMT